MRKIENYPEKIYSGQLIVPNSFAKNWNLSMLKRKF